ncbi:hypothetical protein PENTCL1PPCAC_14764, partial [Pristionchus entomophagus]
VLHQNSKASNKDGENIDTYLYSSEYFCTDTRLLMSSIASTTRLILCESSATDAIAASESSSTATSASGEHLLAGLVEFRLHRLRKRRLEGVYALALLRPGHGTDPEHGPDLVASGSCLRRHRRLDLVHSLFHLLPSLPSFALVLGKGRLHLRRFVLHQGANALLLRLPAEAAVVERLLDGFLGRRGRLL